jgi:hypothetical protein
LLEVTTDLAVATCVLVFRDETTVDLAGGVPLLGRGSLVGGEDVVNDQTEGSEDGSGSCFLSV